MSTYLGYSPRLYAAISVPHHPEISVSKRLMIYERCVVRNELCRLKYVVEPWELEHQGLRYHVSGSPSAQKRPRMFGWWIV
jgi:hypothetical protein